MIEKFTDEELAIIKKELGVSDKTGGSKKSILAEEKKRLNEIMPPGSARYETFRSMWRVCDHVLENYAMHTDIKTGKPKRAIYTSIWDKPRYKAMMNDLLDVVEKYRRREDG